VEQDAAAVFPAEGQFDLHQLDQRPRPHPPRSGQEALQIDRRSGLERLFEGVGYFLNLVPVTGFQGRPRRRHVEPPTSSDARSANRKGTCTWTAEAIEL